MSQPYTDLKLAGPAFTLLGSRIKPSVEWPATHCIYPFEDGTYLSIASDGTLLPGITLPQSGEAFYWTPGSDVAVAVRGDRAYSFLVDPHH